MPSRDVVKAQDERAAEGALKAVRGFGVSGASDRLIALTPTLQGKLLLLPTLCAWPDRPLHSLAAIAAQSANR